MVLFSHSFALSIGRSSAEPLHSSLGTSFGQIAVDVFFLTRGFPVTVSLLAPGNVKAFAKARCLHNAEAHRKARPVHEESRSASPGPRSMGRNALKKSVHGPTAAAP